MKRVTVISLVLVMVMALAGCNAQSASMIKTVTSSVSPSAAEGALPMVSQLVAGTFRLEDTDQAVTAEQAKELLPLWKAYRSMSGSTSSSQVELQALVKQVRSGMTEEQLAAITAMNLTANDVSAVMTEQGVSATTTTQESNASTSSGSASNTRSTQGGSGVAMGGPEGGAPLDGGSMGGGEMPLASASSGTQGSRVAQRNGSNATVSTALLDALVNMLAAKV